MALCGANKRYSPPVVVFRDFVQPEHVLEIDKDDGNRFLNNMDTKVERGSEQQLNKKKVAMLLFRVEETTSQSQFLAHYSFTPIGKTPEGTAFHVRGGKVIPANSTLTDSSEEDETYSKGITDLVPSVIPNTNTSL